MREVGLTPPTSRNGSHGNAEVQGIPRVSWFCSQQLSCLLHNQGPCSHFQVDRVSQVTTWYSLCPSKGRYNSLRMSVSGRSSVVGFYDMLRECQCCSSDCVFESTSFFYVRAREQSTRLAPGYLLHTGETQCVEKQFSGRQPNGEQQRCVSFRSISLPGRRLADSSPE